MNMMTNATLGIVLVVFLLFYLVLVGIMLANYIMTAIGLQAIAKRRGVNYPWLAWIPYANYWLIGSIADDYDNRNGLKKRWSKILLGLLIGYAAGFVLYFIAIIALFIQAALMGMNESDVTAGFMGTVLFLYIVLIVFVVIATILSFIYYICLYKIFESTVPDKSAKYLILSLVVPLASGICILKCRDKGYSLESDKTETSEQALELPEDYSEEIFEEED